MPFKPSVRALVLAGGSLVAAGSIGAAFAPALLTHAPLALIAISPLYRHLVLVATKVDILPFLLVGVPARMLGSVVGYMVGTTYGEQSIAWMQARYPRMGRMVRILERWFVRAAPLLLFAWPGPLFCALAGAGGMRPWLWFVLATAGQTVQVAVAYVLGEKLSVWLAPIVEFFGKYTLWTTVVCVLLVVLYHWWRRPRTSGELDALSERPGER